MKSLIQWWRNLPSQHPDPHHNPVYDGAGPAMGGALVILALAAIVVYIVIPAIFGG